MEFKFKSGKTKIKFSYEGEFKELFENFPSDIINYYSNLNKAFEKYVNESLHIQDNENNFCDSHIMLATGHDIYNYVARYGIANFQLQAILYLDGRLDYEKLSKAVRLSVEAEPVFACRFIEDDKPYWKKLDNIDKVEFCLLEESDNPDTAISQFLESNLDMENDPMVKVKLIRSDSQDTLCIKVNHVCCDGTGLKEYIQLLSNIYSSIDQENGTFIPIPSVRSRKDQDILFSSLKIADPETAWIPGSEIQTATWLFPWKHERSNETHYILRKLPYGQLDIINEYAKFKGVKVNDLILTSYCRALQNMGQPIYGTYMEITVTVDLRRYLPDNKTEAIRNFSGSVNFRISLLENETFQDTLSRVVLVMNNIKNNYPGLQSAIGLERLEKMSFLNTLDYYQVSSQSKDITTQCPFYYGDRCIPSLSNLGFIDKQLLKLGEIVVTDVSIIPPVVSPPGFLLLVSSYNEILTLSAGYYEASINKDDVEKLIQGIIDELMVNCKV